MNIKSTIIVIASFLCLTACDASSADGKSVQDGTERSDTVTTDEASAADHLPMPAVTNEIIAAYPELMQARALYEEAVNSGAFVKLHPVMKEYKGDGYEFKVDITLWDCKVGQEPEYCFQILNPLVNSAVTLGFLEPDRHYESLDEFEQTLAERTKDTTQLGGMNILKETSERIIFADKEALKYTTLLIAEDKSYPSIIATDIFTIVNGEVFMITYGYPAYLLESEIYVSDILDSFVFTGLNYA